MQLKIVSVKVILTNHGPDLVCLQTELPEACWPYEERLSLDFKAGADRGADYVREHFGIEPEIINTRK